MDAGLRHRRRLLQRFLVDLPGGPSEQFHSSRLRVLHHVLAAARETGRVWAISYDIAGMPADRTFEVLTRGIGGPGRCQVTQGPQLLPPGRSARRASLGLLPGRHEQPHDRRAGPQAHRLLQGAGALLGLPRRGRRLELAAQPRPRLAGRPRHSTLTPPGTSATPRRTARASGMPPRTTGPRTSGSASVADSSGSRWSTRALAGTTSRGRPRARRRSRAAAAASSGSSSRAGRARRGWCLRRDVRRGRRGHGDLQGDERLRPPRRISWATRACPATGTCDSWARGRRCCAASGPPPPRYR